MTPQAAQIVFGTIAAVLGVVYSILEAMGARAERERYDPSLEREVKAAVGPVPKGLSLSVGMRSGPGGRCARIAVGGVCPQLTIGPERRGDIDLGDGSVDDVFAFAGPRPLVQAVMDYDTRAALLELGRMPGVRPGSIIVGEGVLRVDALRPLSRPSLGKIVAVAAKAVAAARRLQTPADIPQRLAANALTDPERGVRLANLRTLLREHADQWVTRDALRRAAAHEDPELRLMAALAMGEEGRPMLVALARDAATEDESAAGAIEALGALPLADLQAVLAASLRPVGGSAARPFTARACADLLARCGDAAVPLLAEVARSRSEAVALAGVRALRRIGTVEAVLPLTQAAEAGVEAVREAARAALQDIQLGLTGTPGAVSLADGEAGVLSLVEDPSGRMSLPDDSAKNES